MTHAKPSSISRKQFLIADDHPLVREALARLIDRQPDLQCCGECGDIASTLAQVASLNPELLVLDLRLGSGDVIELIKSLKARFPLLPILVISQHDETLYVERVLRAGARGYVMKEEATDQIINAIRAVLRGQIHLSRKMSVLLLNQVLEPVSGGASGLKIDKLSDRELHIFQLIGAGLSTSRIAGDLHLSVKTVETHRENIKHKLDLPNGKELVRAANAFVRGSR
jgi:DNA-binding NarL/FixJ family response regulator